MNPNLLSGIEIYTIKKILFSTINVRFLYNSDKSSVNAYFVILIAIYVIFVRVFMDTFSKRFLIFLRN